MRRGTEPPRFARGAVAAGQRQFAQAADARRACTVNAKQFAAPDATVVTEPDAVQRNAEHGAVDTVLGDHGGDVRMVVLYADQRDAALRGQTGREARAVEVGMQVVRDRHRFDREYVEQVIDGFLERHAGRGVVE